VGNGAFAAYPGRPPRIDFGGSLHERRNESGKNTVTEIPHDQFPGVIRWQGFLQMRCSLIWFAGLVLAVVFSREGWAEDRPNILFAISDDQSFPHASAYGTEWVSTPAFDRVAREGLLFTRCYTPNAKCAPSRASILTGRNSWQLEEAANHWCYFPAKFATYAEVLGKHGYVTGMTGKGWAPGVARDAEGKSRQLAGKPFSSRRTNPPTSAISANDYAANFADFLDTVSGDQPFCFWFGATEPHRRYEYESGAKVGGKSVEEIDHVPAFWPDNEVIRNDLLDYAFEIEHFDQHLGRMLDELQRRGMLDNTLVVVTSDNGMPFPRVKGQEYELSNHLPLAIMWRQGIRDPGRSVSDLVSFIDLAPTYLEAAGIDWGSSGMANSPGVSLISVFRNQLSKPHREFVLIGKERHDIGRPGDVGYPVRGIIRDSFLLLRNFETDRWPAGNPETGYLNTDGSPTKTQILNDRRTGKEVRPWQLAFGKRPAIEMFNIELDQDCMNNLAGEARYADSQKQLMKTLEEALREEGDPRIEGQGEIFDRYPYANEGERGFYEKFVDDPASVKAGWVNASDFETTPIEQTDRERD
jgi:hypothetical protein